ncbi:MAG: response regulator, partial [Pseudomonadota bacterium]
MYQFGPQEGTYESTTGEQIVIGEEFFSHSTECIEKLFEEDKILNWLTFAVNKEDKLIPLNENIILLRNNAGEVTASLAIIRDITEQRKAELALITAKDAAEAASNAKSAFLANMSHEIRTPMNGVIGFTDILMDTALDDEQRDYAHTIKRSGEALLSLINDILDFSKIESGHITLEKIDFDIEMLAYDACEMVRPRLGNRDVELLCRIGDVVPALVKGDPHRYRQVMINLMGNAVKFTDAGEIELSLDVEQEQEGRVLIHTRVRDSGVGVPENKLETIFEIFQQADTSTTRKYGGTGLGLSICRMIAKLMGGHCWVENGPGKGSTFHFTAWLEQPETKQAVRISPVALVGKKVAIADDNHTNLEILTHILESAGMQVAGFTNGRETLEEIKRAAGAGEPCDICVLDVRMPGMSGYEVAQGIRESLGERPPLLAFTSSTDGGAEKCFACGFNGFLPKPIKRVRLYKMLERLLGEDLDKKKDEEKALSRIITQHTIQEDAKHSASILLAEDNPVNQKLAVKLLTKGGYTVDVANNGKDAVEKFSAAPEQYDIILMDIQMPELNGFAATQELRKRGFTKIPIVAMTANAMAGDREKCLEAGMDDYIAKPIKREIVFEMLKKWVFER